MGNNELDSELGSWGGAIGKRRLPGNVVLFHLLARTTVTAVTVSDTLWDQLVLTDAAFEPLGPSIQDLVVHAELRNLSSLFECRVLVQHKYLDADWAPTGGSIASGDLLVFGASSVLNTADYSISAAFTDRTRLGGVRTRLLLQYHSKSTGGGVVGAKAEISLSAAVRLFCC